MNFPSPEENFDDSVSVEENLEQNQNSGAQGLLGMDGKEGSTGLRPRNDQPQRSENSQVDLSISRETTPSDGADLPQVRQPALCEPVSPLPGEQPGQYAGRQEQGSNAERQLGKEVLQVGAPIQPGKHLHPSGDGMAVLPEMPGRGWTQAQALQTLENSWRTAKLLHESGLMPKALNSPQKIMVGLQLCVEHGLPPLSSIGKVAVINNVPSFWGELPLALVQRSGMLEIIEESLSESEAVCTMKRRGSNSITRRFNLEDAKKAGLLGKDCWKYYPKRMMQMRARSWCIKDAFPDVLMGLSIAEYDHNVIPDGSGEAIEIKKVDPATRINERFGKPVAAAQPAQ